jgi:hypothetical protein
MPYKKQVHPRWEYSRINDPTQETKEKFKSSQLINLLQEMFKNTNSWPIVKQVRAYHLGMERDLIRQPSFSL